MTAQNTYDFLHDVLVEIFSSELNMPVLKVLKEKCEQPFLFVSMENDRFDNYKTASKVLRNRDSTTHFTLRLAFKHKNDIKLEGAAQTLINQYKEDIDNALLTATIPNRSKRFTDPKTNYITTLKSIVIDDNANTPVTDSTTNEGVIHFAGQMTWTQIYNK